MKFPFCIAFVRTSFVNNLFHSISLTTASSVGKATLWKIAEKKVEREYYGHQKAVTALAFRE